jgi:peptidoglycan L-alanyl-D-glutamate endopeptidase CwlK
MPKFSTSSASRLDTCDERIQVICNEAIRFIDFTVTCGYRSNEEQARLYAIGRTMPGHIVTYKDAGQSIHNEEPSRALDFVPYPIDWDDLARFGEVAGIMKYIAWQEDIALTWGGDWVNFKDYPHIQVSV